MRRWWRTNALTRPCARRSSAIWGHANDLIASRASASLIGFGAKLTDQVMLINTPDEDAESARRSSAASDVDLASNACTFAWSVERPSRSIGLDVGPEVTASFHAGNGMVKSGTRRRISGAMRLGLEQLASSGEAEGSHVSAL